MALGLTGLGLYSRESRDGLQITGNLPYCTEYYYPYKLF